MIRKGVKKSKTTYKGMCKACRREEDLSKLNHLCRPCSDKAVELYKSQDYKSYRAEQKEKEITYKIGNYATTKNKVKET